jgi:hypothetical protein
MRRYQEVSNILSKSVHSAGSLKVAIVPISLGLHVCTPMSREELVIEFEMFFGLSLVEVLKHHKDGLLEAKFSRDM